MTGPLVHLERCQKGAPGAQTGLRSVRGAAVFSRWSEPEEQRRSPVTSSATAAPPELAGKAQEPRGGPGGTGSERGGGSNRFVRRRKGVLVSAGERRGVFCLVRKHCARPRCHCWLLKGQRTVAKPCGALSGSPRAWARPSVTCCADAAVGGPPGAGTATTDGAAHGRRARARVPAGNRASP